MNINRFIEEAEKEFEDTLIGYEDWDDIMIAGHAFLRSKLQSLAHEMAEELRNLTRGAVTWDQEKDIASMIDDSWRKQRDDLANKWDKKD